MSDSSSIVSVSTFIGGLQGLEVERAHLDEASRRLGEDQLALWRTYSDQQLSFDAQQRVILAKRDVIDEAIMTMLTGASQVASPELYVAYGEHLPRLGTVTRG